MRLKNLFNKSVNKKKRSFNNLINNSDYLRKKMFTWKQINDEN